MTKSIYKNNSFISKDGVYYPGVVQDIKKSPDPLRPFLEVFTNSLEAVRCLDYDKELGIIYVKLFSIKDLNGELIFDKLVVEDNGVGFDEENFDRLLRFKDFRKGYKNKGSGRIQIIHFFDQCNYQSTYKHGELFRTRKFTLSKARPYLENNSIVFYIDDSESEESARKTLGILSGPLDDVKNFYNSLNLSQLKEALISHYLLYFCLNREKLPQVILQHYDQAELLEETKIESQDIPEISKEKDFTLNYSQYSAESKSVIKTDKLENFTLRAFKIQKDKLQKNEIRLTSKDEIVENVKINLAGLSSDDSIENNRYLFLLSGSYIDNRDSDTRGDIRIPSEAEFKKEENLFTTEEILLDDIQAETNRNVFELFDEIRENVVNHERDIEELKRMFLLPEETLKNLSFHLNESEEKILSKVYSAEAEIVAKQDAGIKHKIDQLDKLDPSSDNYGENFEAVVSELVKEIPLHNRATLTHYIARRQLVLELFQKILDKQLDIQKSTPRNIDEKLLHNLIFQQSSSDPDQSDLWLVNEDFVYFNGTSEGNLGEISIDGVKILKENMTPEEIEYCTMLEEDRTEKRPDILLFPDEGKCIIVEFKNPNVNLSRHINQITNYASLIRNLSKDEFSFDTFYGYLIGEKLNAMDVRNYDGDFKNAYHFDYVFRPAKIITGNFGRSDGTLYTEVIKYSTLLERASRRNAIFLDKIRANK